MKDLTRGSIARHVAVMAAGIGGGMLLQTLYFFVDLYFVAKLGEAAIAGVAAAGNLMFVVFALSQMLAVGTVAMVSHAVGREDRDGANHVFNQSVVVAALLLGVTLAAGYAATAPYMGLLGADAATVAAGETFLRWYLPGLALQFPIVVMSSALRGTGIVKPAMIVQGLTVIVNIALAPVLIAGWGTGRALGVAGAGLASTLATALGTLMLAAYFARLEHYVRFDARQSRPRLATWLRMANIGLPSGGEFALMALFSGVLYWCSRDFGAAAQAGFGVGGRVTQMFFLPAIALAFAAAPVAGQNFGARHPGRVRETFRVAAAGAALAMALVTAIMQWRADALAAIFTADPAVVGHAAEYLRYISWNFVAGAVTFTCSSLFQAMGNTWPALGSSAMRVATFVVPALWMARQPWFQLHHVLMLSVASNVMQALVSWIWLRFEFRARLDAPAAAIAATPEMGAG